MADYDMEVSVRRNKGKGYRMNLLRRGLVPAVVYGKSMGSLPLEVFERDVREALAGGRNTLINLSVSGNGGPYKVMIRDLQYDPVRRSIIHADFQQVSMRERINADVPVQLAGEAAGGIPRVALRSLEVSCLPASIPAQITVDIEGRMPGDVVTVSDLKFPGEVRVLNDPAATVVIIQAEGAGAAEEVSGGAAAGEGTGAGEKE